MIRARALRETITLYTAAETGDEDRYGNATIEEDDGVEVAAMVSPMSETEQEIDATTRVSQYRVIVGPDVSLDALSRVEWRAESYEVVGEPATYVGRGLHHQEFIMRRIEGG